MHPTAVNARTKNLLATQKSMMRLIMVECAYL
jgi:hypothetical protein